MPDGQLRIFYSCTACARVVRFDYYRLRKMYGNRIVCAVCAEDDRTERR